MGFSDFVRQGISEMPDSAIINFMDGRNYSNRSLSWERLKFLEFIGETRSDEASYKKYLMITVTGKEIFDLNQNNISSLIRKNVPEWVMKDVNNNIEVEALVFVRCERESLYFKSSIYSDVVFKMTKSLSRSLDMDSEAVEDLVNLNNRVCAKFKINKIIKTEVDETGEYTDSIKDIAESSNIPVEHLDSMGKMKPFYSLNVSDYMLFPMPVQSTVFVTKFKVDIVYNDDIPIRFKFKPISSEGIPFNNMGTVWG